MENTSKALIIVAAVLVVIIIIAFGIKIFSSGSGGATSAGTMGKGLNEKSQQGTQILMSELNIEQQEIPKV